MMIRLAVASDLPELATLYRKTVQVNAAQYYTAAQIEAWAASSDNLESFRQFILGDTTYVGVDNTGIVGFVGIGKDGHISSAYVRHDRLHQGIGSTLMQRAIAHANTLAMPRLYAEASEFSLGLFKKFGFHLYDTEQVEHHGVQFSRYLMQRFLD